MSLLCGAGLLRAFVPAETDVEPSVSLFFSVELVGRGFLELFRAEPEDVTDGVLAALVAFCCLATDVRFLAGLSLRNSCSSAVPGRASNWLDPSTPECFRSRVTGRLWRRCGELLSQLGSSDEVGGGGGGGGAGSQSH
jgi:hypothetical protein